MTTTDPQKASRIDGRAHKFGAVVRRRSLPGLAVVLVVALLAGAYAKLSKPQYSAELVFVVPAVSAGELPPGNADQANKLATSMAGLIPVDRALLAAVATRAQVTLGELEKHLSVTNDSGTSLVRIDYTSATRDTTSRVLSAFAFVLTSASPPGGIAKDSLQLVNTPQSVTASGHSLTSVVALGVVAGLVLAVIAGIALERASPRLDGPAELAEVTQGPVTVWSSLTPAGVSALVSRWQTMVDLPHPNAALVSVGKVQRDDMLRIGDGVARLGVPQSAVRTGASNGGRSANESDRGFTLRIADMADPESSGDDIAQVADLSVLVVAAGERASTVSAMVRRLENYGVTPRWSIIVRRSELADW